MIPTVYILGRDQEKIDHLTGLLADSFEVDRVISSGLMAAVYQKKPQCIVVIQNDFDQNSLETIDATLTLDYIPVISVSYDKKDYEVVHTIANATYITGDDVDVLIHKLVEQACSFASRYHELNVIYDTYEIMNEEVRTALDVYVDQNIKFNESGLLLYFTTVYKENIFLENQPDYIWMLKHNGHDHYYAGLFDLNLKQLVAEFNYFAEENAFDAYRETGFIKNVSDSEISDINDVSQLIPEPVMHQSPEIDNVACFAVEDVMLVAFNFGNTISQMDLNILKALTTKVDMMSDIRDQMSNLEESFIYTMNALARAAEGKDDVTGHHIKRVNLFSKVIAEYLDKDEDFISQIEVAAQMHDVGKILVADAILNKPGRLTDEEFDTIKSHTVFGERVIGESEHLKMAARIARSHHEKYDGTGYPDGLAGERIPEEARIVALADVYDALRSPRSYKPGFTHEEAYKIIVEGDGRVEPTHFDPKVLKSFVENHRTFRQIYDDLQD